MTGVILDLDGTLLDTERLHLAAFRHAASTLGIDIPYPAYQSTLGLTTDERCHAFANDDAATLAALYRSERDRLLTQGVALKIGAAVLLETLRSAGTPIAVATSASRTRALALLTACGIAASFGAVIARDDVGRSKPAPDAFLTAAHAIGRAPGACVAIEDSLPGLIGAREAGMCAVMVPDTAPPCARARAAAAVIVDDLHAVAAWLQATRMIARTEIAA